MDSISQAHESKVLHVSTKEFFYILRNYYSNIRIYNKQLTFRGVGRHLHMANLTPRIFHASVPTSERTDRCPVYLTGTLFISHHTYFCYLTFCPQSAITVTPVTLHIVRNMWGSKQTRGRNTAMLCLVPRDPTHLAACRRWTPALHQASPLCASRSIDRTLLSGKERLFVCKQSITSSILGKYFSKRPN